MATRDGVKLKSYIKCVSMLNDDTGNVICDNIKSVISDALNEDYTVKMVFQVGDCIFIIFELR